VEVRVGGRTVNLAGVLPLRVKDWKALEARGINPRKLGDSVSVTDAAAYMLFVLQKADPAVTSEDVDDLSMAEAAEILKVLNVIEGAAPDPNS